MELASIQPGDTGEAVARLQRALIGLGYLERDWDATESAASSYDAQTAAAVACFR